MRKFKTKCDFCKHFTGSSCMTIPNSKYCREALDEYYQYLANLKSNKVQPQARSLRPWDKR